MQTETRKISPWSRFGKPLLILAAGFAAGAINYGSLPHGEDGGWMGMFEVFACVPALVVVAALVALFGRGTRVGSIASMAIAFLIAFEFGMFFGH